MRPQTTQSTAPVAHLLVAHHAHSVASAGPWTFGWEAQVAIGTLLLAVAALLSARAAINIDRKNAARQVWRDGRHERAVARLIWSELHTSHEAAERAMSQNEWPVWERMDRSSWTQHGDWISAAMAEDDFRQIAHTYDLVSGWQDRLDRFASENPGAPSGGVLVLGLAGSIPREQQAQEALHETDANLRDSLDRLHPLAFPDARDIEPNPDWKPPWWKIRWWRARNRWRARRARKQKPG